MYTKKLILLFLVSFLGLTSCSEENTDITGCLNETAVNYDATATVSDNTTCVYPELDLTLNFKVGAQALNYNELYTIGGTDVSFETVQFYMANMALLKDDGTTFDWNNLYVLAQPETGTLDLEQFLVANYTALQFEVGIDAATNAECETNLTTLPATNPLSQQTPAMNAGASLTGSTGYLFVRIDGDVDTDGDGDPETQMRFHLFTDPLLRSVSVPLSFSPSEVGNNLNLNIDIAALFNGIDLSQDNFTMTIQGFTGTMSPQNLANAVADNVPNAFSVD